MKPDDEGKPFNPRDPLKDYSKKDKKADGGRKGLRIGLTVKVKMFQVENIVHLLQQHNQFQIPM